MKYLIPALLLLCSCTKNTQRTVEFKVDCDDCNITWTDSGGGQHSEQVRDPLKNKWSKTYAFDQGAGLHISACSVPDDLGWVNGVFGLHDTLHSAFFIWAYVDGERVTNIDATSFFPNDCATLDAVVPKKN